MTDMSIFQDLSEADINELLESQLYGHLGCTLPSGEPYVVPITFAYHEGTIYSVTRDGMKLEALRAHPSVCLQVEQMTGESSWRSAIVWGAFQELSGKDAAAAMKIIFDRLETEHGSGTSLLYTSPKEGATFYRIAISRKTGKSVRT